VIKTPSKKEQNKLKNFLNSVVNKKNGYELGEPWKFSDTDLLVAVPIIRKNAPKRSYITMYEALKDIGVKDTGSISQLEMQNKTGMPVFIRVGTIFSGKTQNRATQHSGVYKNGDTVFSLDVRCVHLSHGINRNAEMKYGSIAPLTVTYNLMFGDQSSVWSSINDYTGGKNDIMSGRHHGMSTRTTAINSTYYGTTSDMLTRTATTITGMSGWSGISGYSRPGGYTTSEPVYTASTTDNIYERYSNTDDDLLGYLNSKGKSALDEALETIPLFEDQTGVIIFDAVGVLSVETFDSPKSWEAIKNDIKEKYGDKTKNEETEHLFDLNKDKIVPIFTKFINKLDNMTERVRYQDDYSTTMSITGDGIVGEYTMIKGKPIHCLLVKV